MVPFLGRRYLNFGHADFQICRYVELRGGKDSAGRQGQRSGGPTCGDPGAAPLMAQMGRDLDDLGQMVAFQVC